MFLLKTRFYSKVIARSENIVNLKKEINFKKLRNPTKVPILCVTKKHIETPESSVTIDKDTIKLLERLSLVNLTDKQALETLQNSIQFAEKIINIETTNISQCYTILQDQDLYLRSDKVTEGECREDILQNAKVTEEDYFVSPPGNIPLEQEEKNF